MLNKIPACLSPDLVRALMIMGHGEGIIIADANFPAVSNHDHIIRADGLGIPEVLDAILELMPLDTYHPWQVALMKTLPGDDQPPVWKLYDEIIRKHAGDYVKEHFERFEFYELAKETNVVLLTGETALYGNIILKKGVVLPND